MSSGDIVGIVAAVFLFLLTAITSLIAWIFLDTRRELRSQLRVVGKHMDSLITTCWGLTWRTASKPSSKASSATSRHGSPFPPPTNPLTSGTTLV